MNKKVLFLIIILFAAISLSTIMSKSDTTLIYEKNNKIYNPCFIDKTLDFFISERLFVKVSSTLFKYSGETFKNSDNWIIRTCYNNKNNLNNFNVPYSNTSWKLMSGVWGQLHGYSTVYIHYPKNKTNKLVVFCHGYAGNLKMYQGIINNLDNCVILSLGTSDITGIYTKEDIQKIFNIYIPFLKDYPIKEVHIVGLSNGGTAIDAAIKYFPNSFKSYTVISSNLTNINKVDGSINFIGGRQDKSSNKIKTQHKKVLSRGIKSKLYNPEGDHFLLVMDTKNVIDNLNDIIK